MITYVSCLLRTTMHCDDGSRTFLGLSVFLQFKDGSSRQGRGSAKFRVPEMKWVGLRPSQLDDLDLPEEASKNKKKYLQGATNTAILAF